MYLSGQETLNITNIIVTSFHLQRKAKRFLIGRHLTAPVTTLMLTQHQLSLTQQDLTKLCSTQLNSIQQKLNRNSEPSAQPSDNPPNIRIFSYKPKQNNTPSSPVEEVKSHTIFLSSPPRLVSFRLSPVPSLHFTSNPPVFHSLLACSATRDKRQEDKHKTSSKTAGRQVPRQQSNSFIHVIFIYASLEGVNICDFDSSPPTPPTQALPKKI